MIMMMTDPDRVALSAFLPCISVSFHSPIHANFNAHLPQECPPLQFVTHLITPSILVRFHIAANLFVFFPLLVNILACMPGPPSLLTPSPFILCAAPLSRSSSIFTSCNQAANNYRKKLAIKITSRPLLCKPARVHAPAFDYLCIYYPWRYLSRTKKKDLLGKRGTGAQKNAVRSEQYFIVVPIQETIIKA